MYGLTDEEYYYLSITGQLKDWIDICNKIDKTF